MIFIAPCSSNCETSLIGRIPDYAREHKRRPTRLYLYPTFRGRSRKPVPKVAVSTGAPFPLCFPREGIVEVLVSAIRVVPQASCAKRCPNPFVPIIEVGRQYQLASSYASSYIFFEAKYLDRAFAEINLQIDAIREFHGNRRVIMAGNLDENVRFIVDNL